VGPSQAAFVGGTLGGGGTIRAAATVLAVGGARLLTRFGPTRSLLGRVTGRVIPAPRPLPIAGRIGLGLTALGGAVAGGAGFEGALQLIERAASSVGSGTTALARTEPTALMGGTMPDEPGSGQSLNAFRQGHGGGGFGMGAMPGGDAIVNSWTANGVPFVQAADGRIAVQRKNGTVKVYRPPKMIVVSRNPRIGTLLRAHKRIDKLMKGIQKRAPRARAPRAAPRGAGIHHARDV